MKTLLTKLQLLATRKRVRGKVWNYRVRTRNRNLNLQTCLAKKLKTTEGSVTKSLKRYKICKKH